LQPTVNGTEFVFWPLPICQRCRDLVLRTAETGSEATPDQQLDWDADVAELHGSQATVGEVPKEKKKYRLGAYEWSVCFNNQIGVATGAGLEQFQVPKEEDEENAQQMVCDDDQFRGYEGSPTSHLSLCLDQGSDGFAWIFFAQLVLRLRLFFGPDHSHRSWNDSSQALKGARLWAFVLLHLISLLLPFGPWDEGKWQSILWEAAAEWRAYSAAKGIRDPLFQSLLPFILKDLGRADAPTDEVALEIYNNFDKTKEFINRGEKPKIARWWSWMDCVAHQLPSWSSRVLAYAFVGKREGWLKSMENALVMEPLPAGSALTQAVPNPTRTAVAKSNMTVSAVRKATKNSMHLVTLHQVERRNRDRASSIYELNRELRLYHGLTNHEARSLEANAQHCVELVNGKKWMLAYLKTWMLQEDEDVLQRMGYTLEGSIPGVADLDPMHPLVAAEDAMALENGTLVDQQGKYFFRGRACWWGMWPNRVALLNGLPADRERCMKMMGTDFRAFKKVVDLNLGGNFWGKIRRRSCLNYASSQHIFLLGRTRGFQDDNIHPKMFETAKGVSRGHLPSKIVEDGIGAMKHVSDPMMTGEQKWLEPSRARILSRSHHYPEICPDEPPTPEVVRVMRAGQGRELPKNLFEPTRSGPNKPKLDLSSIVGEAQAGHWESCNTTTWPGLAADLEICRVADTPELNMPHSEMQNSWLSVFCHDGLVLRKVGFEPDHDNPEWEGWFKTFGSVDMKGVIALPVVLRGAGAGGPRFIAPKGWESAWDLDWKIILDLKAWEVLPTRKVSPIGYQVRGGPRALAGQREIIDGEVTRLDRYACRKCFWQLPETVLRRSAPFFGITDWKGVKQGDLYGVLRVILEQVLEGTDVLPTLGTRLDIDNLDLDREFCDLPIVAELLGGMSKDEEVAIEAAEDEDAGAAQGGFLDQVSATKQRLARQRYAASYRKHRVEKGLPAEDPSRPFTGIKPTGVPIDYGVHHFFALELFKN
jgi:hypothetical protein